MKYGVLKTTVDLRRMYKIKGLESIKNIAAGKEEVIWENSGEEMVAIMKAIINKSSTTAIVNMPNKGQIDNMPSDAIVETLSTIDSNGVRPKECGQMPDAIGSLCRLHSDVHELSVKAALKGDRKLLIEAISLDPSSGCMDFSEIPDLADELLLANKQWLPRFF